MAIESLAVDSTIETSEVPEERAGTFEKCTQNLLGTYYRCIDGTNGTGNGNASGVERIRNQKLRSLDD